jgi:hypothetical protein
VDAFNPVYSYYWPLSLQQTYTAADGTYRLEGVPPGRWWAFAFDEEAQHGVRSDVVVKEGTTTPGIDFRLTPVTGEVSGVVRGPDGTPVKQAFLRLTRPPLAKGAAKQGGVNPREEAERYTDADGKYRFEALTPGSWRLYCASEKLASQVWAVDLPAEGVRTVDFTLTRGGTLTGRVITADGTPVAGAWITTAADGAGRPGGVALPAGQGLSLQGARSAPDGTFTLPSLSPGRYTLSCTAPGYAPQTVEGEVVEGQVKEVGRMGLETPR